jgi:hypothetical protein
MSLQLVIALGIGGELVAVAIVMVSATLLLRLLGWLDAGDEPGEAESGGGGDGGEDPLPEQPSDGGGDSEPWWWPDFEREFAEHVERLRRARPS